jgi:ribosomal protein S18 acetylase RimI-like enzyme
MSQVYPTTNPNFILKLATDQDAELVVRFMKKLGDYQNMADEIIATAAQIEKLLKLKLGEAVFGWYEGEVVGFAYFHQKSSAFTGRSGLYIDGFFIDSSFRDKGLGKIMMQFLSKLTIERGGEMLEWGCLDWNISAIDFYQKLGSYCIDSMHIYRLSPDDLQLNAEKFR